jgi:protein TonB
MSAAPSNVPVARPPENASDVEVRQAERILRGDPIDRRRIRQALVAALVLHGVMLAARMPGWGPDPVRVETPLEQSMQVKFMAPPPAPVQAPAPKPEAKKIPRPDPTPTEPEPVREPEPAPAQAPVMEAPPAQAGPVRVTPGQGPGLIKRVEPTYPPALQAARREGVVTLDAIIYKDGTVGEVKVLDSPHPMFAEESVRAVQQWRFSPFSSDVILTVTVRFTLRN